MQVSPGCAILAPRPTLIATRTAFPVPLFEMPQPKFLPVQGTVSYLSHDGRGVVRIEDRVYFVAGALRGEEIEFVPRKKRRGQFTGDLKSVITASPDRVTPRCNYFGVCGGCTYQHLSESVQVAEKQQILLDTLRKIGRVTPDSILAPLSGDPWGYRRKARPGCKYVEKKGGILVGFREQGTSYLTSLRHCDALEPRLSALLDPLHTLIAGLSCFNQVPQIEMAAADNAVSLVIRHLAVFTADDLEKLKHFARHHQIQLLLQSAGPDSIVPLWPENPEKLQYRLSNYDLVLEFTASDFVQVNGQVNEMMIEQAIEQLALRPELTVLDLFCGLGNFTLPLAKKCASVVGVEGDPTLVEKGKFNAGRNNMQNVRFEAMDLHSEKVAELTMFPADRVLLDPPRSGALEVVTHLVPELKPQVIVYVSCNPATLARDADILVHHNGYRLAAAGAINMFPHTAHIEAMATFILPSPTSSQV